MSLEAATLARPYAKAVFEYASSHAQFAKWSHLLQLAAEWFSHPDVNALLSQPKLTPEQQFLVMTDGLKNRLDQSAENFLQLLTVNRRLNLLADISAHYEHLRATQEKTIDADVVSAFPLQPAQKEQIKQSLTRRLQQTVNLHCREDKDLLGGAIIRAGDLVIDGSVKSQLTQLYQQMRR